MLKKYLLLGFCFFLLSLNLGNHNASANTKAKHLTFGPADPVKLPFQMDGDLPPLRSKVDDALQNRLTNKLNKNAKWKQLITDKKLAVGLVDIRDPYNVKFARINGNEMMYAASLPKIAILLAAMDALEKGELTETKKVTYDMHRMICNSDNHASTRMIDCLGYQKIEDVLTDSIYQFYDEEFGGGLWIGKRYAASGLRHPDPIKGLSHAATVSQVCRFYYQLAMGKLVNYERSKQMLDIMVDPALHHKMVYTIDRIAPEAKVYRKSGSWGGFHSDSALVWGKKPSRRYILVALTEDPQGEKIIRDLVKVAEDVLKIE